MSNNKNNSRNEEKGNLNPYPPGNSVKIAIAGNGTNKYIHSLSVEFIHLVCHFWLTGKIAESDNFKCKTACTHIW